MKKIITFATFVFVLFASQAFADYYKFTKKNYAKYKDEKAVVIYHVNWGRQWGCAQFENAQLQKLSFTRIGIDSDSTDIKLKTPSKLFVKDVFNPYVIIVEPGEYAISGFDVKVAKSVKKIAHIKGDVSNLFENGKPIGGTFKADTGEIVYIGEFGLDCAYEPIPWRYYREQEDFDSYVEGFRQRFKFVGDREIIYRLFETEKFGQ